MICRGGSIHGEDTTWYGFRIKEREAEGDYEPQDYAEGSKAEALVEPEEEPRSSSLSDSQARVREWREIHLRTV